MVAEATPLQGRLGTNAGGLGRWGLVFGILQPVRRATGNSQAGAGRAGLPGKLFTGQRISPGLPLLQRLVCAPSDVPGTLRE